MYYWCSKGVIIYMCLTWNLDEMLLKCWDLSGAKACKSFRSRQKLSNEYLLQDLASMQKRTSPLKFDHLAEESESRSMSNLTPIFQQNDQTLEGSFSSVSAPICASKHSFCSIFRDLQDLQSFAPLRSPKFSKKLQKFGRFSNGAKVCHSCRSRQVEQNDYLIAKIGADTEENEPSKVWWFGCKIGVRYVIVSFN